MKRQSSSARKNTANSHQSDFPQPGPVSFHRRCISPPRPPPPAATSAGRRGHHRPSPPSPVITGHLPHPPAVAAISSIRRPSWPSPASAGTSGHPPRPPPADCSHLRGPSRPPQPPATATSGGPSRPPQPPATATSGGPARPSPPNADLRQRHGLERGAVWTAADNESYTSRLWVGFFDIHTPIIALTAHEMEEDLRLSMPGWTCT
jgi:hypothetical protein